MWWTKAIEFLLDKDNQRFVLFVAVFLAIGFGVLQCERKKELKHEVQKQKDNIEAMVDVVKQYQTITGEIGYEKLTLQVDKEQLKTINKDLYTELEKEKGKVEQLIKANAEISSDTVYVDSTRISPVGATIGSWRFNWSIERQGEGWNKVLEGMTQFQIDSVGIPYDPRTIITKDRLLLQLVTGIKTENGKKKIFVRSTYPDLTVTNLQGAILEDKSILQRPSKFGIGFSAGYGMTTHGLKPYVGISLNYNLIQF